ncbi:MAG: hypothetical protein NTV43_11680 [Methylococcales bacterium]|nr:hypothetical protein [Methylococcales bacterium]
MNNILPFSRIANKYQENDEVEAAFIGLLDKHCDQKGTVKPLPTDFIDRIEQLKAKALEAKKKQDKVLLEG